MPCYVCFSVSLQDYPSLQDSHPVYLYNSHWTFNCTVAVLPWNHRLYLLGTLIVTVTFSEVFSVPPSVLPLVFLYSLPVPSVHPLGTSIPISVILFIISSVVFSVILSEFFSILFSAAALYLSLYHYLFSPLYTFLYPLKYLFLFYLIFSSLYPALFPNLLSSLLFFLLISLLSSLFYFIVSSQLSLLYSPHYSSYQLLFCTPFLVPSGYIPSTRSPCPPIYTFSLFSSLLTPFNS